MQASTVLWDSKTICLNLSVLDITEVATNAYDRTCRTDFDSPGFCIINCGKDIDSVSFRQIMVDLKTAMANVHQARTNQSLIYLSAARFDQQESTKPHLDSGPDECFLMLGYEATEIRSEIELSDYSKCALDLGMSPNEFMSKHNPMFQSGSELLRPYTTLIPCFSPENYQIVCINNSSASYSPAEPRWLGVLHTARVLTPDVSKRRVINSTMIANAPLGRDDILDPSILQQFIQTSEVKRRVAYS